MFVTLVGRLPRALYAARLGGDFGFDVDAPTGEIGVAKDAASFKDKAVMFPLALARFFADLGGEDGTGVVSSLGERVSSGKSFSDGIDPDSEAANDALPSSVGAVCTKEDLAVDRIAKAGGNNGVAVAAIVVGALIAGTDVTNGAVPLLEQDDASKDGIFAEEVRAGAVVICGIVGNGGKCSSVIMESIEDAACVRDVTSGLVVITSSEGGGCVVECDSSSILTGLRLFRY